MVQMLVCDALILFIAPIFLIRWGHLSFPLAVFITLVACALMATFAVIQQKRGRL
jgi:predicted membrane protein